MATYVTLYRYTDEGMRTIDRAVERAQRWEAEARRRGVRVHALYWLEGQYDAITISEADNENTVLAWLFAIGAEGTLRTETMRAYSADDVARVLAQGHI